MVCLESVGSTIDSVDPRQTAHFGAAWICIICAGFPVRIFSVNMRYSFFSLKIALGIYLRIYC